MTTLREAAQQALEALDAYSWEQVDAARTALRAALAEPVQEQCKGAPGECEFNGGCMYACAKPEEHCLWARNGNEPCPHVHSAEPVQEPVKQCMAHGECFGGECIYTLTPQRPAEPDTDCHAQGICQRSGYSVGQRKPVQEPQEHLLQQALEALLMMRDRYGEYACPACDHADAAVYALKAALAEEALQRLTDVSQEIEAALAAPEYPLGQASTDVGVPVYVLKKAEPPCNPSCAPGYCYCDGIKEGT